MGILYFLAGLFLSEPIIQVFFKKYFSKDSVPDYAEKFMEECSDLEERHESADEYSAQAIQADPSDSNKVLIAKELTKVYVFY